jgi:hypothetical protein
VRPSPSGEAGTSTAEITIAAGMSAAAAASTGAARAFDRASAVHVRVLSGGATAYETTIAVSPAGADITAPLRIDVPRPARETTLDVEVRYGGAALFRGAVPLSLRAGRRTAASVTLDPVIATVTGTPAPPSIDAYGEALQLGAAALFATGDTLDGATPTWTSSDEDVVTVTANGTLTTVGDGEATVTAAIGGHTHVIRVQVFALVSAVVISPASPAIAFGDTVRMSAVLMDRRGNVLRNRPLSWSSSNPAVLSMGGDGLARGIGIGSASIVAGSGTVASAIDVSVTPVEPEMRIEETVQLHLGADIEATVSPGGLPTTGWFEWSLSPDFDSPLSSVPNLVATGTLDSQIHYRLHGLRPGRTYYVRGVAQNTLGTVYTDAVTLHVPPLPPSAVTGPVSTSAAALIVLNGSVNTGGVPGTAWFEIGTHPMLVDAARIDMPPLADDTVTVPLTAQPGVLLPGTTYYYRIATLVAGDTVYGLIRSFGTAGAAGASPGVQTRPATVVTGTTATLNALVSPNMLATTVRFRWGVDPTLQTFAETAAHSVTAGSGTVPVGSNLVQLAPATTYYFRALADNAAGSATGAILSFTTPGAPPSVATHAATGIAETMATLHGLVVPNQLATGVRFHWGTDPALAVYQQTPLHGVAATSGPTSISVTLHTLAPQTTYYFRFVASNLLGSADGDIHSFTTAGPPVIAQPPTVTTLPATEFQIFGATLNGSVNPNGQPASVWFEYSTSPTLATFNTSAASNLAAAATASAVSLDLGEVPIGTTYFRVVAANATGTSRGVILSYTR